jgi:squalene synthase HpnC
MVAFPETANVRAAEPDAYAGAATTSALAPRGTSAIDSPALAAGTIRARAASENFPVVLWGLPRALREALLSLYDFARLVDQLGDDAEGDRMAGLDALSEDLLRIREGEPRHPILRRLAPVVRRHDLPIEPLERLIEANRRDQSLVAIASWDDLLESCRYSANPVGELVLALFGCASPHTIELSDAICSALQIVEHCQDVREDVERGRVYLPAEDLVRLGCAREDLDRAPTSLRLRRVVSLQVDRARGLLARTDALLAELRGLAVPLVAAYAAGGLATCDALERHGFDVTSQAIRPTRRAFVRRWSALLWRRWIRPGHGGRR